MLYSTVMKADISGQKFGRLEVLYKNGKNKHGHAVFVCVCDCGKMVYQLERGALITGNTKSCGCLDRDKKLERNLKHGCAFRKQHHPLYKKYHGMLSRCNNPKASNYDIYGGRGIKCLWTRFEDFKKDMEPSWLEFKKKYPSYVPTIERINFNGNYCKENCRWATYLEQGSNTRRNHFLTFKGKTLTLSQWARHIGSKQERIRARLKLGFTVEEALVMPKGKYRK